MPPRGFEPLITGLKGRCPRPLDDGGQGEYISPHWQGASNSEKCLAHDGPPTPLIKYYAKIWYNACPVGQDFRLLI
jgi:hypothetical protein